MARLTLDSPIGRLRLSARAGTLTRLEWCDGADTARPGEPDSDRAVLEAAAAQLADYFAGRRRAFALPLAPAGSAFQRRVYQAMMAIPYGCTRSYGELAAALGSAARAVGAACGSNPLPILVPCHRVVASGGRLGGYSGRGGADTKRRLLALEQARAGLEQPLFAASDDSAGACAIS